MVVDHINGNGLDNRMVNLRVCTAAQNSRNRKPRKGSLSGYRGVSFYKNYQKWVAQIMYDGVKYYLGYFSDPKEAALAYDAKARELHGDYARVNFP
jgi:hypothetical protein